MFFSSGIRTLPNNEGIVYEFSAYDFDKGFEQFKPHEVTCTVETVEGNRNLVVSQIGILFSK